MASKPAPKKAPPKASTKPAAAKKAAGAAVRASKKIAAGASKAKAKTVKQTKPTAPLKPPGRPSIYTPELATAICTHIAEGKSLRIIGGMDGMPHQATIMAWLDGSRPEFSEQYARAREAQADKLAEEALQIADDGRSDTYLDAEGNERTDNEVIQRSRLRVDTRKWLASKMAPKKYGDKVTQEHTGADGGAIQVASTVTFVRPPARDEDDE